MASTYGGIERVNLESAVRDGLNVYQERAAQGDFRLVHPSAYDLRSSEPDNPCLPTDLLSSSSVPTIHGTAPGLHLDVVVLAPGDGTGRFGGETSYSTTSSGLYPKTRKVIPPPKAHGTIEAILPIASFGPDGEGRVLHAIRLEGVGLVGRTAVQQAELGQSGPDFHAAMLGQTAVGPHVEYTMIGAPTQRPKIGPWALYNNTRVTQIIGVVHTTGSGTAAGKIFDLLGATIPRSLAAEGAKTH